MERSGRRIPELTAGAERLIPDCRVSVDNKRLDLGRDAQLTRVLIDLDIDLFGQCCLIFNDPALSLINDAKLFAAGVPIKVELGFGPKLDKVFEGEVVALEPRFTQSRPPSLRVICHEPLHRLALAQMTRSFNQADDQDVVKKIAQEHGYSSDAPAGTKEYLLQGNLSDAAFLRKVAQRHGSSVRLVGKTLMVGPAPSADDIPLQPGDGLQKMRVRIKGAGQFGEVSVHGWDAKNKCAISGSAKPPPGDAGEGARAHGGSTALRLAAAEELPADITSAEAAAKARLQKLAERFVVAKGEMIGNAQVQPGRNLALDKMGEMIDGRYRVEHASHEFSKHGYRVSFSAVRIAKKKAAPPAKVVIAVQPPQPKKPEKKPARIFNPLWSKQAHDHGEQAVMSVDAQDAEGRKVNFTLEQHTGNDQWSVVAKASGLVSKNKATAQSELEHPAYADDPPDIKHSALLKEPRWKETRFEGGEEVEMQVKAPNLEGREVRFIVERQTGKAQWEKAAQALGKVSGGVAKANAKVLDLPPRSLKKPRWSSGDLAHGDQATMAGEAPGVADGTRVRFIVETQVPGTIDWRRIAEVFGAVRREKVEAKVTLEHPVHAGKEKGASDRRVRFRAQVLPDEEVPKPLKSVRWVSTDLVHAEEAVMAGDAPGEPDGREVRFIIETLVPGSMVWKQIAEARGTVQSGKVEARAKLEHPGHSDKESDTSDRKLRFRALLVPKPVSGTLRFRAELLHDDGPSHLRFRAALAPEFEPA
jgi:phage protein D